MSKFTDEIKAEIEESNIRLSFQDNEVFMCDVFDRLIDHIEQLEYQVKYPLGIKHSDKCSCSYCV